MINCSGVSIFVGQNDGATPSERKEPTKMSLMTCVGKGAEKTNPTRKEKKRMLSCLGLTQTTLRGIPRRFHRLASLNQRTLGMPDECG